MNTGDDTRPDGRPSSPETLALREATRALRLHLDKLPVDYDQRVTPQTYVTRLAFMNARNRYDAAESMIGAGFGGTVIGSLARSLLVDGLRWIWLAERPHRQAQLLGDLINERNRITKLLLRDGCDNVPRWLMPIPPVADLAGASRSWDRSMKTPSDDELIDWFLDARGASETITAAGDTGTSSFVVDIRTLMDMPGLRGAALILAHAGHGNYLGQQSTLTPDGAPGFDLRADHEALFMHVAAVAVVCVLVGANAVDPDGWPIDVERKPFIERATTLARDVATAAPAVHQLRVEPLRGSTSDTSKEPQPSEVLVDPVARLSLAELMPTRSDLAECLRNLAAPAEVLDDALRRAVVSPYTLDEPILLHATLTYGFAVSGMETVLNTFDQAGSEAIAVFAARALLEEAARLHWRYSPTNEVDVAARAKQYFDEYRSRQRKTIGTLANHGIKKADADRLFHLPANVRIPPGVDQIAKGRVPVPTIAAMLRDLGAQYGTPGWLETAYSLLSQFTHATPLGALHTIGLRDGLWNSNEISPEMLALTLDVTAQAGGYLVGTMGLVVSDLSPRAITGRLILQKAAARMHEVARRIHGLDNPDGVRLLS